MVLPFTIYNKGGFTIYNVIQISSFLEYQVDDTKCKTVFKNSISTSMETQVWKHKETQACKHKEIETQIAFIRKNLSCLYENFERGSPITICFVFKRWINMNFRHATWNCHLLFVTLAQSGLQCRQACSSSDCYLDFFLILCLSK